VPERREALQRLPAHVERAAQARHHEDGEVGPRRLARDPRGEALRRVRREHLLGEQHGAGALLQRRAERRDVARHLAGEPARAEGRRRELGVAPGGGEDQEPLRPRPGVGHASLAPSCWPPTAASYTGAPVRTPRKEVRGLPTCTPFASTKSSRMVVSCAPVRFFTTESAFRTPPSASK